MKSSLFTRLSTNFNFGVVFLVLSVCFFGWDIINDTLSQITHESNNLLHTIPEVFAFVALLYALKRIKDHSKLLESKAIKAEATVTIFKEGAGKLLQKQLDEVKLSKAEKQITLLILKGLSPTEISELRQTALGTVKTQTTSIFRKFQVKSRSELLSQLIHEVLDLEMLSQEVEIRNYRN